MLPLRFPWVWLASGWLLVLGVCAGSLLPGDSVPDFDVSDEIMHAASYFLLMVWFAGLYRRGRHVLIAVTLLALGVLLEIVQEGTGYRTFDYEDMLANGTGIAAGLLLSFWLLEGWCLRVEKLWPAGGA